MSRNYELKIENELFEKMRNAVNAALEITLKAMLKKGSDDGTVSLKISIHLDPQEEPDDITGEILEYKNPVFGHKVSASIKQKIETPDPGEISLPFAKIITTKIMIIAYFIQKPHNFG